MKCFVGGLILGVVAAGCGNQDASGAGDGAEAGSQSTDASGSGEAEAELVKIGSLFSTTGPVSAFGTDGERSVRFAIDRINEEGFEVGGQLYRFDYETRDLASDPNQAATAMQELVEGFGADIIIGPDFSGAVEGAMTVAERAGDVMVLSVATALDGYVSPDEPYLRTSVPDTKLINEGYIPTLREELPGDITDLAVLMPDDATTEALLASYLPAFEEHGFEVVQQELFAPGTTDFAPVIQRLDGDIDGIFIGYNNDAYAAGIMDAALEQGLPPVFITRGISALPGNERTDQVDIFTWNVLGDDPIYPSSPEAEAFLADFSKEFDLAPERVTWFPFAHYDYLFSLVEAMQEAGTVEDVDAIAEAMRGSTYDGVVTVSFDEQGVNTSPMKAGILEDGETRVVEQ